MSGRDEQIFCDGIGSIAVTGSVIRIEFVTISMAEQEPGGNPKLELTHRVVMPIDGFLGAVGKLQETVQALVRRGVIRQPALAPVSAGTDKEAGAPGMPAIGAAEAKPAAAGDDAPTAPRPALRPFP